MRAEARLGMYQTCLLRIDTNLFEATGCHCQLHETPRKHKKIIINITTVFQKLMHLLMHACIQSDHKLM